MEKRICNNCKQSFKTHLCRRGKFCSKECFYSWNKKNSIHLKRLRKQGFQVGHKPWNKGTSKRDIEGMSAVSWRWNARKIMNIKPHSGLIVHHKDGDITNNKKLNLQVFPNISSHIKLYWQQGDIK